MKRTKLLTKTILAATLAVGSLAMATDSEAKPKKCPNSGIICTTQYDPVICDNNQVYGNACFASAACATGCVPYEEPVG
jgi:hypothetical protein